MEEGKGLWTGDCALRGVRCGCAIGCSRCGTSRCDPGSTFGSQGDALASATPASSTAVGGVTLHQERQQQCQHPGGATP